MAKKSNNTYSKGSAGIDNSLTAEKPNEAENNTEAVPGESGTTDTGISEWLIEKLTPYLEVYPTEKLFYITSDGQVFLEKSHNDAVNHQRRLDKTKEVISFVVE